MKKISVIIPVYNVESYIEKCLDSLVNQTLKEIEIIVVNDGSPDGSQIIIDEYVKKYPKLVKSYTQKNGGQGSARNFGIKKAVGEYISFVDSDDYIEHDMLEKMYTSAISNKSDVVICGNKVISMNYEIIKYEKANLFYNETDIIFGKMAVWNKLYRKDILKNINFRSGVWYEDIDYTIKVLLNTKKISFVNECLYNYLLRPGSTMNNSNVQRNLEIITAFDEIIDYFKKNKKYLENKAKIEFLAIDHIYISAIVRIIRANVSRKEKKIIINKLKKYVEDKFPDFNKNKYLKKISSNRKNIYLLIKNNLYCIVSIVFRIK